MILNRLFLCPIFLALVFSPAMTLALQADDTAEKVRRFLNDYCVECHGGTKQESDRRFDRLAYDFSKIESIEKWQEVLDQLNRGVMPPDDAKQPDELASQRIVSILSARLKQAYADLKSTGQRTVTRRLNRFELRNTIRDLLYLNDPELRVGRSNRLVDNNGNGRVENTSTDPFRAFPADEVIEGFDNIGNRLVMSDYFLKLMLDAAEESLDLATVTKSKPRVASRLIEKHIQKRPRGELGIYSRGLFKDHDSYYQGGTIVPDQLGGGVGVSARYRIKVEVSAVRQKHPWGELIATDQSEPFRLGIRLYKTRTRNEHLYVKEFEVPADGKRRTYSVEAWIDKRWTPQLSWENGPSNKETRVDLLLKKYLANHFKAPPDRTKFADGQTFNQAKSEWSREMATVLLKNYRGPELRVHRLELVPVIDEWPPRSHRELFGDRISSDEDLGDIEIRKLLLQFATRAFRRPVKSQELNDYFDLVKSQLNPKMTIARKTSIQNLSYKAYKGQWSKLPDFSKLKPVKVGDLPLGLMDIRLLDVNEKFGLVFEGNLVVETAGEHVFQMASDDGARMYVGKKKVVEHDGLHGASIRQGKTHLNAGTHPFRFEYFAYGNPNSLKANWSGPDFKQAPLAVIPKPANPVANIKESTLKKINALKVGYAAILCSPDFLYLQEKTDRLNSYEIASRLSYFLWSSMPDRELVELAEQGKLTDPLVVQNQVERMLSDSRSAAFVHHFTERWLRLDKLAESPPELNGPFRIYWDRKMEPQIVEQTNLFFADVLRRNGSVKDLIDSKTTFMNEQIGLVFYGRSDVRGEKIRRVELNDSRRGGIFTQPSVMTATANGVDTSPVIRGVWVLENVLGTKAPPPPPDVEPLPPDLRNAKTIREQLVVHRKQAACNNCHRKIDPLGFPLENFDPIGRWRTRYRGAREDIDSSAVVAGGASGRESINGIVEFKEMLLRREDDVAKSLIRKLLSYSSGRLLEAGDRGEVDRIVDESRKRGHRLKEMLKLVVTSKVFLSK